MADITLSFEIENFNEVIQNLNQIKALIIEINELSGSISETMKVDVEHIL